MKKMLIVILVLVVAVGVTNAQIANTKHDFSSGSSNATTGTESGTCIYCHTPHTTNGADLLWNKGQGTISTYNTVALASTAGSSGEGSTACMSCHDGATAIGVILNESGSGASGASITITDGASTNVTSGIIDGGMPDMTTDLSGDHPVGILYSESIAADASGFVASATVTSTGGLKLTGDKVECNSCHDPHDNTNGTFLRKSNASSALCITCHSK